MTTIETEKLIEFGWKLVEIESAYLQSSGNSPVMKWVILDRNGDEQVVVSEPEAANNSRAKEAMSRVVREIVAKLGGLAVFFLSDVYLSAGPLSPEGYAAADRMGIDRASQLGLIPKRREAIMCAIETPVFDALLVQFYRREADAIVLEERKLIGRSDSGGESKGRMLSYFDQPEDRKI